MERRKIDGKLAAIVPVAALVLAFPTVGAVTSLRATFKSSPHHESSTYPHGPELVYGPTKNRVLFGPESTAEDLVPDVLLNFDRPLNPASVPPPSAFSVTVNGMSVRIKDVFIDTEEEPAPQYFDAFTAFALVDVVGHAGDDVVVRYTPPDQHPIRDRFGRKADGFTVKLKMEKRTF